MKINFDCLYHIGNKPCNFHKMDGRSCKDCKDYQKVVNRILVIKLDALGDVLRTTSILPALFKKYPNSVITWLTRKNAFPLLENNVYISRILGVEENYLEFILNEKFDVGINLDVDPLSATILSISKCRDRMGFMNNQYGQLIPANKEAREWYLMGVNDHLKRENRKTCQLIIYEICKLKTSVKKPQLILYESNKTFAIQFSEKNNLDKYKKIIGINTGGGSRWEFKKWTLNNYIRLIELLKKTDQKIGIILFGGPEEKEFNQQIKEKVGNQIVDTGCHNSILQFSALIDLVDVFLTPDSLGMHISIALDKTTVVLVGPTSPWELDVFGNGEILYNDQMDCIACYLPTCENKINCMNSITPLKVLETIKKYL